MKAAFHTIDHLREAARRRLPRFAFDFMDGGSGGEVALRRNRDVFREVALLPRALVNCERRDSSVELLGQVFERPFGIAPIGLANLIWPGADEALARAAAAARIPYILSTAGTTSIEAIAAVSRQAWFQLYVGKDQDIVDGLISRADRAGCPVLVVTVDVPAPGKRVRDLANRFSLPFRPDAHMAFDLVRHPSWSLATARAGAPRFANLEQYGAGNASPQSLAALMAGQTSARLDWDLLRTIRSRWPRKLVVKGILHPEDARQAKALGADGIVVSNHGGRQLESAPAPLTMLPAIRSAVGDGMPVLIDGGVRSGEDVAKALALGADLVLLGRAFLYGAAALGPDRGAAEAIRILSDELDRAQAQLGCRTYSELRQVQTWPIDGNKRH
jgi:(S)-mandelate dehydrogenase